MSDVDRIVEELQRRVDALEDEAARLRQPATQQSASPPFGNRRQILLSGAGLLSAWAGSALLGHAEPASAAPPPSDIPALILEKHLTLQATLTPLKTRGALWANHEWDFGAHFVGAQPPVVVATALDDYMEHDVATFCVCAVAVHGTPGAYRATLMVRNISAFATE